MNDLIAQYETACHHIASYFVKKYFETDYDTDKNVWWIANEIGGCLCINDHFFSIEKMLDYMKNKATPEQMFEHYEYVIQEGNRNLTYKAYKKLLKPDAIPGNTR